MKKVYKITKQTQAILTKHSPYYRSEIWEEGRRRHSLHSPLKIIKENCSGRFEERTALAQTALQSSSKLPIVISPEEKIYMFPTESIRGKNLILLSYHQIKDYIERDNRTYIEFLDGTGIYVKASAHIIDQQYKKTGQLIVYDHREQLFGQAYSRARVKGS
ncbi:competence protein ComK [Ralstonia pickettii]|nr:competence protein ComK [Ralstonia pickettii]